MRKIIIKNTSSWNKRILEYKTRIKTGSFILLCGVVRDLYLCNGNCSEQILYNTALNRVVSEISLVRNIKFEDAECLVLSILKIHKA
jgi:RNA polymerase-interacting CarD/CdnL/TRCF family regulator